MKQSNKNKSKKNLVYDLVDIAILPAALLICAKAVGIAILNSILGLDWDIQTVTSSIFSIRVQYTNPDDAAMINSYTNLFMYIVVIAGCMVVTSKSLLFHHRKASPYFVLKLAKYDLLHLLKTSMHIYKEAFVWGIFLILTTIYIFISFLSPASSSVGETYGWIAGLSILFTMTFLWITIQNIEEDLLYHNYK